LFSFGMAHDEEQTLIVLPAFSLLQIPLRYLSRYVRAGGARLGGSTGLFPEYAGNRPFMPGDSPRRIDARAWARLSVPATKEYHDDFDSRTALVLDTAVPEVLSRSGPSEIKELEAAVSLCASVAFTINNDCLIDLLIAGPDLHQFTGRHRMVRLDKIHEILAGVGPCGDDWPEQIEPILADRLYEISEVVFILLSWDEAYRQLLELAGRAGCHSTVLVVGDAGRIHVDKDNVNWTGNVRFVSADEILTGRLKRL
jgi:uncharacterized protein (DUF58 family)